LALLVQGVFLGGCTADSLAEDNHTREGSVTAQGMEIQNKEDEGAAQDVEIQNQQEEANPQINTIPKDLEEIPGTYFEKAKSQGTLEELYYDTYESFSYEDRKETLTKRAIVYLPEGYDETQAYNVFYLMHGGWGNETTTLGTPDHPSAFKNVIDHAIADGKIQPFIIVCPTYNNTSPQDSASFSLALQLTRNYHNELIHDLIPAAEEKYSTYAADTTAEGIRASRDHRGFGGFSMGSVATWRTFQYCLDSFRYFLPMSCGTSLDDEEIFSAAEDFAQEDYFVWMMVGTSDFSYRYDEARASLMRKSKYFSDVDENAAGNFAYRVKNGYSHDRRASMEYTYNGLMQFWSNCTDVGEQAKQPFVNDTAVTWGTRTIKGFLNDNALHSEMGDIHFSSYIPEDYDSTKPYALFITLPGWEGLYFQGVGANMVEDFGSEAIKYNEEMIILSLQLNDWGKTSAEMTILLTEYFLENYNIDTSQVYLEGFSGGGETGSLVMGMRPELYTAYLMVSSKWDGNLDVLAEAKVPVYMAIGEEDSYYGSESLKEAYETLYRLYEGQGFSGKEIEGLLVLDVKEQDWFSERGFGDQHAGGGAFAYEESIMGWLFGDHDIKKDPGRMDEMKSSYEVRKGISGFTLQYNDLPEAYRVSSSFSYELMNHRPPLPEGESTVLDAVPDPAQTEVFYLWEEGNAPARTRFTSDMTGYYDSYDFRPYVTALPIPEGVKAKGAVILLAGGAFQFRGDYTDTLPTAVQLREYGYRCFIVDYRLRPYSQEEGALDVARTVRFIRKNADTYGIDPEDITVMGYSAGGIQAGEFFISADGDVNGSYLDPGYTPDELDEISADAAACGMIYSFYGRLSVASLDVEHLKAAELPPTFYCYGTRDPFYRQFEAQVALMEEVGVVSDTIVLEEWPHGYGGDGGWVADYAAWLEKIFS
jgi:acetyl esterase/lipase/predicted peptidase